MKMKKLKGMTVIEALMAIILFVVSSLMVASLVVYGYRSHLRISNEGLATDRINVSIQNLVEELRKVRNGDNGSYAIDSANRNQIVFYSDIDLDGEAEKIRYFLTGENLFRGITEGTGEPVQYPSEDEAVTKIGTGIVNDEEDPLFSYWGIDEETSQDVELEYPIDISEIRLVAVNPKTLAGGDPSKERRASSKVFLRNLGNN